MGHEPAPSTVLVVDDEFLIRWSVAETLSSAGWTVTEAPDSKSALTILADTRNHFDAVLLDYRLPDVDDLSLLAEVRKRAPDAAVVLMTAFGTTDVISKAVALGASRIVAKPFDVKVIPDILREATASRASRRDDASFAAGDPAPGAWTRRRES